MYYLILYSGEVFIHSTGRELINLPLLRGFNFFPAAKFKKIFVDWFKNNGKIVCLFFFKLGYEDKIMTVADLWNFDMDILQGK